MNCQSNAGELVLEIGCEELPVWALRQALEHLQEKFPLFLQTHHLSFSELKIQGTPRRLAILATGLPERQKDRTEWVTGPSWSVAWDSSGKPTKAAMGFAGRCGVPAESLQRIATAKGEYLGYEKTVPGRDLGSLLAEALPDMLAGISFARPMHWSEDRFVFIRPVRWLLALFEGQPLSLKIADVQAGSETRGHRFLGSPAQPVRNAEHYRQVLAENSVVLDMAERRAIILRQLQAKAAELEGRLREDRELLDEVCGLNEFPMVIAGAIRREFLGLPEEVLITVMRKHQKYFCLEDDEGRLVPWFLAVTDSPGDPQDIIRRGHERVLEARLNDAAFFWKVDTEKALKDRLPMLDRCLFHLKLGSYLEKTRRIESIAMDLSSRWEGPGGERAMVSQAARLMKADLATDMVKELTELQGVMGGIYARQEGMPAAIWEAIYDQYLPRHLEDSSPRNKVGALLSLADRMDTLAGCFGVGIIPRGSSDPYALRRQAQGVVKILWDHDLPFTVAQLTDAALAAVEEKINRPTEEIRADIGLFFEQRIRYMLQQRGFSYDVVNAALAGGFEPPTETLLRTLALQQIRALPDFLDIAVAFKRVKNILKDIDWSRIPDPDPGLFREEAEKVLAASVEAAFPMVKKDMDQKQYFQALKGMAQLRPAVQSFFDQVLVMAPETNLRENRLALLRELSALFLLVGDISEIVMDGEATRS